MRSPRQISKMPDRPQETECPLGEKKREEGSREEKKERRGAEKVERADTLDAGVVVRNFYLVSFFNHILVRTG